MTRRLYWDDPALLAFEAEVTAVGELDGANGFILAETAFYPEAGGQLSDHGRVHWEAGTGAMTHAAEDAEGNVLHLLEAGTDGPAVGDRVRVEVDGTRRRDHMRQHTGQHMLSRALLDRADADTVSSRLGETVCTIDLSRRDVSDEALADAEGLVNRIVGEDRPVTPLYPSREELVALPVRRDVKEEHNQIRLIDIDGFDLTACGGTHCARTGHVGQVHVIGLERYKGGLRISFHAGGRAVRDYAIKDRALREIMRELSCGVDEVAGVVNKLREEARQQKRTANHLRQQLARFAAAELLVEALAIPTGGRLVARVLDGDMDAMRAVAATLCRTGDMVAMLATPVEQGVQVLVQRGDNSSFDAGAALKRIAAACGGRGGGRPNRAEGRMPAGTDLAPAFAAERKALGL